ncbi:NCK-interacting protein with SH3 domain isoform X2 [Dermatophagoides pteronyssinus]|uniref:NCK-interacting protein with SH3 domain isoform X2 n=1 Tax=Dermatophagoides pteronyssinus TaxID=6956 RepID=UPI003F674E64
MLSMKKDKLVMFLIRTSFTKSKLAQMRCEITETLIKLEQSSKPIGVLSGVNELSVIQEENKEDEENNEIDTINGECLKKCRHCCLKQQQQQQAGDEINEQLISNLIENIKLDSNLSESKAIIVANSVIKTLSENVQSWQKDCQRIMEIMEKYVEEKVNSENVYSSKLKCIFKRLWFCKNDTQQRNWPVYQDEDIIQSYLDELMNLLTNTEQSFLEKEICSQNHENLFNLIQYFQMETRRSLRLKLMDIFIILIRLYRRVPADFYLTTVLPGELTVEMKNHVQDVQRWIKASTLFTLIFSSGHKPPVNIYEHINEQFFSHQFDLCEGFDINGQTIECEIPSENIISPILAFNLHITDIGDNVIFKALGKRTNASHFTENLISYLNWEEDIILTSCNLTRQSYDNHFDNNQLDHQFSNSTFNHYDSNQNSVLKFLTEMFADKIVSSLFYYNDVRVIIDIIISQLNNLPVGDHRIKYYLELTANILKNTQYAEEPHKAFELKKCLISIQHHEFSNIADVQLAQDIIERNHDAFGYVNQ